MPDHRKNLKGICGLVTLNGDETAALRKTLLMIYRDIFEYSETNGLTCMLGGGSLLGAVRHGGFIPWDDDMDLMMPRRDYEKLKTGFAEAYPGKYTVQAPGGSDMPQNLFMKIALNGTVLEELNQPVPGLHAVSVDIFPLDYAPDGKKAQFKGLLLDTLAYVAVSAAMFRFRSKETGRMYAQSKKARLSYDLRLALGTAFSLFGVKRLYDLHDRVSRGKKSARVTVATGRRHYRGELRAADGMLKTVSGSFEGLPAKYPLDYTGYLTNLYGSDYMTPPPAADRERHFAVKFDLGEYQ